MPLPNNALPLSPSPVHSCARRLFTLPFLYSALQDFTPPCLRCALHHSAVPLLFRAHRGDSFRCPAIACHCNTSPSLCETSSSCSISPLRQSPLFHCVAEIRIAPQSLRCSSRPKTELSLAYAVLGRAALRLSVAMPSSTPPFLCCARRYLA